MPNRRETNLGIQLKEWVDSLIDLSRRNNLIYFNSELDNSLALEPESEDVLRRFLSGEVVALSNLVPASRFGTAFSRLRKIHRKSVENYEERSIETLGLAIGTLSWDEERERNDQRTPVAPVLVADLKVAIRKGRSDFELSVSAESFRLNQALRHKINQDFGITLTLGSELDGPLTGDQKLERFRTSHIPRVDDFSAIDEEVVDYQFETLLSDPRQLIRLALEKQIATIPGASLNSEKLLVGNFSTARLAMIQDLEESRSELLEHDFVMALADDQEAKDRIRSQIDDVDPSTPNRISPSDEFLILDADSSQNEVINAILQGKSFAFDGPPGTGKSQTIANAIATLVSRGKRVLFVAEKRAAIDAVVGRLHKAGLEHVLMDFHATSQRRRDFISELNRSFAVAGDLQSSALPQEAKALVKSRDYLLTRAEAFHEVREPIGLSLHELLAIAHRGHDQSGLSEIKFSQSLLRKLSYKSVMETKEKIEHLQNLGGFRRSSGAQLWRECSISDEQDIQRLFDFISDLDQADIQEFRDVLAGFATAIGLNGARPAVVKSLVKLMRDVDVFAQRFSWSLLLLDLDQMLQALGGEAASLSGLRAITNSASRAALRDVRKSTGRKLSISEAHGAVKDGLLLQHKWRSLTQSAMFPVVRPPGLEDAFRLLERLERITDQVSSIEGLKLAFEDLSIKVEELLESMSSEQLVGSNLSKIRAIEESLDNAGIRKQVDQILDGGVPVGKVGDRLEEQWAKSLSTSILNTDPRLVSDDSEFIRRSNSEFVENDIAHLNSTPERIQRIWAQRVSEAAQEYSNQFDRLAQTFQQRRNLPSVRKLFAETKDFMAVLKPCWVTSPLSVSTLRPPTKWFDVVIFDEASQIKPVHAISSIKAAKQVVVAGDDEQLPPTNFFADGDGLVDGGDGDQDGPGVIRFNLREIKSLLGATKAIVTRPRQLRWHYRSRDERLIAFSNDRIYRTLTTFPHSDSEAPVRHVLVNDFPDNVTDRATNKAEVRKVVELVKAHSKDDPMHSLGVIALGAEHANAILDALDDERDQDPALASFMDDQQREPFFVKNLERVQGDERDVVILSVGYGRNADGGLNYKFGPVNGQDGYRRLNVATTRAKSRMTIVSAFTGEEMSEERCRDGTLFLRDYLIYARSGGKILRADSSKAVPLNPFEESIQRALEAAGLTVIPQHGVGRYRIDFAVRHPSDPTRFVLAVECDGASYHSFPTARERDRLRQQILEDRGWRFHRIWSTEWFRNPEAEVRKLLAVYEDAVGATVT